MTSWRKLTELLFAPHHHHTTERTQDEAGATLVNHWQRGVPVYSEPVVTPTLLFFVVLAAVGLALALVRFFSPLGPFSGMNDAYAWGIWKTFNVMTLTALGSGPLAVGMAAWVFNREKLHVVMRTALVSWFPVLRDWAWSLSASMWGVRGIFIASCSPGAGTPNRRCSRFAFACPSTALVFLAFENLPLVLERFYYTGTDQTKAFLRLCAPVCAESIHS